MSTRCELFCGELLADSGRCIRQHCSGGDNLDEVRSTLNLLAHDAATIVRARTKIGPLNNFGYVRAIAVHIAFAAMRADDISGRHDARACNLAGRNSVSQCKDGVVLISEISDRREACLQCEARVINAVDR